MKAIVNAQPLVKELKKLSPVIKKNTVLPILTSVKLSFAKKLVTIMATDLETTVILKTECECKTPFDIIMEYADIVDVCSKIFEPITIDASGNEILITCDAAKFKFPKNNGVGTFPNIPEENFLFDLEADSDFIEALMNANNCRSTDDFKTMMNAACIHVKKDSLTIVGTDAFVAYKKDLKLKTGNACQIMVPDQFVQMIKGVGDAKLSIGEKFVRAEAKSITVISRLMDANFCAYETIMSDEQDFNLKINRADFIYTIGVAGITANPATHLCAINFNGGDIKIVSQDNDFGKEGEAKIKAIHTVGIKAIGVNATQMLKLLNLFDSEEVEMAFKSETGTIFLRPAEDPQTLCLLQPLSINP